MKRLTFILAFLWCLLAGCTTVPTHDNGTGGVDTLIRPIVPAPATTKTVTNLVILHTSIYTSYFSDSLHEPVMVAYKLYHGGGNCSRKALRFVQDSLETNTATQHDYAASGYDEGHLANAEDFAGDCSKEALTFRFYNCVPQTPNLNRGIWKHWETIIRQESQTDSILVICGSWGWHKKIGAAYVPDTCWKVTESLSTHQLTHILLFTNTGNAAGSEVPLEVIATKVRLPLIQ